MAKTRQITERGMVRRATPFVLSALSLCPYECRVTRELTIGQGIADVVILRPRSETAWPERPLTVAESMVLSALRELGRVRVDRLGRHVFMDADDLRDLLAGRLADWRLVRLGDRDMVQPHVGWVRSAEVIAVEAKLTRWREALRQATAYREYADRAFVLLPSESAQTAFKHAAQFRSAGVGLLSYDTDSVSCLVTAQRATLHSWHREFALSRI